MPELDPKRIADFIRPFRVEPGRKVHLPDDYATDFAAKGATKAQAKSILAEGIELLSEYQARLAAQDTYGLLVILQAMDAAGKDGTIRHVMSGVNPQGVQVSSFKVPTSEELDHDYLWRYAKRLPERGNIGIFNRSYYEEVLVVRVHPQILEGQKLPPDAKRGDVWERRFREINDWEHYLVDNGFRVVKLFLNVSKEEQRRRFLARIDIPEKNWKFSAGDAKERAFWDDYQHAFSEVLSNTSTAWAPWYVVPADTKAFARLIAAGIIADALIDIDPQYPDVSADARAALEAVKVDLEAEAPKGAPADPNEVAAAAKKAAKKASRAERKAAKKAARKAAKDERRAAKKAGRKAADGEAELADVAEPGGASDAEAGPGTGGATIDEDSPLESARGPETESPAVAESDEGPDSEEPAGIG